MCLSSTDSPSRNIFSFKVRIIKTKRRRNLLPFALSLSIEVLGWPCRIKDKKQQKSTPFGVYIDSTEHTLSHERTEYTYTTCIYTMGRRLPLSSSEYDMKFPRFQLIRQRRQANVFLIIIMPIPGLSPTSLSLPSGNDGTKVTKRYEWCKFEGK